MIDAPGLPLRMGHPLVYATLAFALTRSPGRQAGVGTFFTTAPHPLDCFGDLAVIHKFAASYLVLYLEFDSNYPPKLLSPKCMALIPRSLFPANVLCWLHIAMCA